jgi:hypothetical protein
MAISYNWENANKELTTSNSVKEVHDYCNVVEAKEYKGQSGKTSIRLLFNTEEGGKFASYMGISDKAGEITVQRLTRILVKSVGEEDAKRIFEKVANDEDVNSDKEFVLEFASKVNRKLEASPVKVYVDRVKNGENWQVKWYFKKPVDGNVADDNKALNAAVNKVVESNSKQVDNFASLVND